MTASTESRKHDPADKQDASTKHSRAPVKMSDKNKTRYKPNAEERAAIRAHMARLAANWSVTPWLKVAQGTISMNHPDPFVANMLLAEALGIADLRLSTGFIEQLAGAAAKGGEIDERRLNFMLAVITAHKPSSEFVAMLKTQMAAVQIAFMDCAARLGQADFGLQFDSIQNALNKFARTFAAQMETLSATRAERTIEFCCSRMCR